MTQKSRDNNQGFTIIEILIVLAIAGLILSMVFLAIPTLQRSSRNNQRKQDATAILEAISRYELNNSANFPPDAAFLTDQNVKLSIYNPSSDVHFDTTNTTSPLPNATNTDQITLYQRYKCNGTGRAVNDAADYRDVVALVAIETGNGGVGSICMQL